MQAQITSLYQSKKLTVFQIAQQLQLSKSLVLTTIKDEYSHLHYKFRIEYLGQGYSKNTMPLKGWFREIQVNGNTTLKTLNDCIQHTLGWDNAHCYIFTVHERHYAYLGEDDFVVEDIFENYCSAKIPIYLLNLCENDHLIYNSDFGDDHFFLLTVSGIESIKRVIPIVTGANGNPLVQYDESSDCAEESTFPKFENKEFDIDEINATFSTTLNNWHHDVKKIDFIVGKDKDILEQWRRSKDKRKWEIAVTILENRAMPPETISKKIEKPFKKILNWIITFDYYGLEGLRQIFGKRIVAKGARRELMEQRKKRVIEIMHHKPKFYNINRSSWNRDALAKVYREQFTESISLSTISKYLKDAKYTIKKARRVLTSPDPEYREKVEILLKKLNTLSDDELLFFIDELGPLKLRKYGGSTYSKVHEVKTYPQNQVGKGSISLAGALSATTNQVTWIYIEAKDSAAMISLAEILYNQHYSKKKLYITWDCASWHSSQALVSWLELFNAETEKTGIGPVIEFIPLPACSQFLDVIESVFSGMKRAVIHNSDYKSELEMKTAISQHFRDRNEYFQENPKRAGNKIWEIDFFQDHDNIKSGTYREW